MAQVQLFENPGIGAGVFLPGKKRADSSLEIGEHGILAIPKGLQPAGFHLVIYVPKQARLVIVQKNIGQDKGGYFRHALAQLGTTETDDLITWAMYDPIQVMRQGSNVWTSWHSEKPNRVDCWMLGEDGQAGLFQVGVITHDDGQTFRLLGERRWQGQVFKTANGELVARPNEPKWGALGWNKEESRAAIREHPDFQALLASANLSPWNGSPKELYPPLGLVPPGNFARVDWYIPFAGQKGQGIAKDQAGNPLWVLGQDLLVEPDTDGIKRVFHGDLVSFTGIHQNWGTKREGPPKLLRVQKVQ